LFVLMASRAPVAVVFRRGPAPWAQLTLWSTDRDEFTEGAWFHGRIFAEKCDLSPDGQLLVYAAYQGNRFRTTYTDSWTAVSRPPWLHALALWPMGTTYGGGGRFVGDRRLILRGAQKAHPSHPADGLEIIEGTPEYHRSSGEVDGAQWTGRDQRNRLVYAKDGRIFARRGDRDIELADFGSRKPEPVAPPEWATRPLRSTREPSGQARDRRSPRRRAGRDR
jgi:hypothetical protein